MKQKNQERETNELLLWVLQQNVNNTKEVYKLTIVNTVLILGVLLLAIAI